MLGFIGLCGVLHDAVSGAPGWVRVVAAVLAVAGLVLACVAVFVVGRVAWPTGVVDPLVGQARLRRGVGLTVVAVVLVVVATLAGWWPAPADAPSAVVVTDAVGQSWCGSLVSAPAGVIGVGTARGVVDVPVGSVARVGPVAGC